MRPSRLSVGGVRGPFDGELPLDGRRDSRLYLIRRSRIVGDRVTTGGGTAGEAPQQYRCSQGQGGSLIRSAHRFLPPALAAARVGKSQRRPKATETLHAAATPCHPHVTNPPKRASRPTLHDSFVMPVRCGRSWLAHGRVKAQPGKVKASIN